MNGEWLRLVQDILTYGRTVSPRSQPIRELDHQTIQVDMTRPILSVESRKLNYRFMYAEALWILNGDDRLSTILPYNRNIAQFSDDGVVLAGAYGPKVVHQLDYVLAKLLDDRDTRQATLTLWEPNPQQSKDIPCTVAMDFKIRDDQLNAHVFMRSSDVWLGLPYDVFVFSCIAMKLMSMFNGRRGGGEVVTPGTLFLTAASSHIYERDAIKAHEAWKKPLPGFGIRDVSEQWWLVPGAMMSSLEIFIQ